MREENIVSLRALGSYLKEKLSTWLSPAALELHQITWDDPASLLEKIVDYEVLSLPCLVTNLVALMKNVAQTVQVPSAREKETKSSGFCCKFSLTQ
ncbi:unnamed protein product [Prunus armeniaca]